MKKRKATKDEVDKALLIAKSLAVSHMNQDCDIDKMRAEAIQEGYNDEFCEKCGTVFLAHHHFVRCDKADCPMKEKGGKSLLEALLGDPENE